MLISGANGAGKTSFARQLLPFLHIGVNFLNVDEIQRLACPPLSPIAAAREFVARLARAESACANFAVKPPWRRRHTPDESGVGNPLDITSFCTSLRFHPPISPSRGSHGASRPAAMTFPRRTFDVDSHVAASCSSRYTNLWFLSTFTGSVTIMASNFDNTDATPDERDMLALVFEAARRTNWDALHGPRHLRAGKYFVEGEHPLETSAPQHGNEARRPADGAPAGGG